MNLRLPTALTEHATDVEWERMQTVEDTLRRVCRLPHDDESRQEAERFATAEARELWRLLYENYRQSAEWQHKRSLVILRCAGICEGCRQADVEHIHHLSYNHVGRELLYELVGLCKDCHDRAHDRDIDHTYVTLAP